MSVDPQPTEPRPRIAAEVRAWAAVAAAIVCQLVGTVWWAATLSAQVAALREVVTDLKAQIAVAYSAQDASRDLAPMRSQMVDHEARIRVLENRDLRRNPGP